MAPRIRSTLLKARKILIIGGGVGLAPLRALLYALFNDVNDYKRIILKYGSRTPKRYRL